MIKNGEKKPQSKEYLSHPLPSRDTQRYMDPVLSKLRKIANQQTEINNKLDIAVTKDDLKKRLAEIKQDILSILQEKLDKLEVIFLQIQLDNDEQKKNNFKVETEKCSTEGRD